MVKNIVDIIDNNCIVRVKFFVFNLEFIRVKVMAKAIKVKVKMESTAGTGTFFVAEKNPRTHPEKLVMKKFDKKSKKHEEFVEKKLK